MKKLGVIVPIYNTDKYLRKCIESIINQTYKNIKLVLVDDGSTDMSGKICDEYAQAHERITVVHQENKGMIPSRYTGIKCLYDCEYVTFVDSDDWVELDAYEKMSKYMEKSIDVISFDIIRYFDNEYQYVSKHKFESKTYFGKEIDKEIYPFMIWDCVKNEFGIDPSLCNKIMKYEIICKELEKAKNCTFSYGQDVAITYPMIKNINSIVFTDNALYFHRQGGANQVADYLVDRSYYQKLYLLYDYLCNEFIDDKELMKQINFFYTNAVQLHLRQYKGNNMSEINLVPFDLMKPHKRIILYGAAKVGEMYYSQIKKINYGEIVGWVDKNAERYSDYEVKDVDSINKIDDYDYILIAVKNEVTANSIRNNLVNMGIPNNKIIWRY